VTLDLPAGPVPLTLRLEDLHERDTVCYFSLTLLDGRAEVALPPGFDAEAVDAVAATMASLRTDRVFYTSGPVRLLADVPPPAALTLRIPDLAPFSRGGLVADPGAANAVEVTLTPEAPHAALLDAHDAPSGCVSLPIETTVGGATLVRRLGTTILPKGHALPGDLPARKARAADIIAAHTGSNPPSPASSRSGASNQTASPGSSPPCSRPSRSAGTARTFPSSPSSASGATPATRSPPPSPTASAAPSSTTATGWTNPA
jgi:hypothetical protein